MSMSMNPWEQRRRRARECMQPEPASFTPQELAKLQALRTRMQESTLHMELGLDDRRLGFARWLVEHGKLGEGLP